MVTKKRTIVKKKTQAIAKNNGSEKRKAVWLGAQALMGNAQPGTKEAKEKELVLMTSRALGVSPFGVNILGSLPYINKLGLGQKAQQYHKDVQFKYRWIKRAMDDNEKAICECKLVDSKGKDLSDWVTGECSPKTMSMSTLNGYQNHMAQTRAKNRAILETFGVRIHEDMIERIQQLSTANAVTSHQAALIGGAVSSSGEEIQMPKGKQKEDEDVNEPINGSAIFDIRAEMMSRGAATKAAQVALFNKLTANRFKVKDFSDLTAEQAQDALINDLIKTKGKK